MDELCTYKIEVQGEIAEEELNANSPISINAVRVDTSSTHFSIRTDQSGLIGLMRYFHTHGLIFLTIQREP